MQGPGGTSQSGVLGKALGAGELWAEDSRPASSGKRCLSKDGIVDTIRVAGGWG